MTEAIKYPASVFWSDEDGGFIAIAPDLPGCSAFGKTQSDALAELQDAISGWVEAARAVGNPVPEPSPKPEPERYSGKLVLRLPRSLHARTCHYREAGWRQSQSTPAASPGHGKRPLGHFEWSEECEQDEHSQEAERVKLAWRNPLHAKKEGRARGPAVRDRYRPCEGG